MNKINNQRGFSLVELAFILVVLGLVGFSGWWVYTSQHKTVVANNIATTTTNKSTPKASAQIMKVDPFAGWKKATFPAENLSLRYPSDWAVNSTQTNSNMLVISKTSGSGELDVSLYLAVPSYASGTASSGFTSVSTFTFDSKIAYIVKDAQNNQSVVVSSCPAPAVCYFQAKSNGSYGIVLNLAYNVSGEQQVPPLDNDVTGINEGEQIMSTLAYITP